MFDRKKNNNKDLILNNEEISKWLVRKIYL